MHTPVQRAATWFIMLAPLWLSACIDIEAVRQPASGQVNTRFEVQIDGNTTQACEAGTNSSSCTPYLAVSLPAGWVVESCSYTGSAAGTCSADSALTPSISPTTPANSWRTFAGQAITTDIPSGSSVTATLRIRPTTSGTYTLDYQLGAIDTFGGWGQASMDNPITIRAVTPVTAVPTMNLYGYGLMALGLAAAALRRRKLRRT